MQKGRISYLIHPFLYSNLTKRLRPQQVISKSQDRVKF